MSEAAECAVACFGLCCMELCRRRHESGERFLGNKQRRIEILFQSTEFHLLSKCGFTVGQASRSSRNEDCCEECYRVCCEDCCCENNEVAATTQVVYVARGGIAESLGVQVGWYLERVGEIDVYNMAAHNVQQILSTMHLPVVLTFVYSWKGRYSSEYRNKPAHARVYAPPEVAASRNDYTKLHGPDAE